MSNVSNVSTAPTAPTTPTTSNSLSEKEKMDFIYNSIEKGFTVKKIDDPDRYNCYQFSKKIDSFKVDFINLKNSQLDGNSKNIKTKRSFSVPGTKKEIIGKLF